MQLKEPLKVKCFDIMNERCQELMLDVMKPGKYVRFKADIKQQET